ncbi:MAG: cupin [Actinobacteria bacterium]|nr:cupin [Actinomycetota bacterium]
MLVGTAFEDWTGDAEYHEYTKAANPIVPSLSPPVPIRSFPASLHRTDESCVATLDLSAELGIDDGPATSPGLCAAFLHICPGDRMTTAPVATSELYHVLRGDGFSVVDGELVEWSTGDTFVLPSGARSTHHARSDTAMYHVTDEPLLRYLGVTPSVRRFGPTMFRAEATRHELDLIAAAPRSEDRNRLSVLLAGAAHPRTRTATHVLWAMYGLLPEGAVQRPHRHQSVALDLILDCEPGCYSLLGARIDEHGDIIEPTRVDWEPGGAFVTPPGMWHAHVNESGASAHLFPVQDAGLQTYLRSLDIRFTPPRPAR